MTIDPKTNHPHVVAVAAYASQHSRRTGSALRPWWIPDLAATAKFMNDTREGLEAFTGLIALQMIEGAMTMEEFEEGKAADTRDLADGPGGH
jgi:hypothetical protein